MARKKIVRFKRGQKSNLPETGIEGMPYFTMDTGELYVGLGDGENLKKIATQEKIITFVYKNGRDGQFGPSIKFPYEGKIISANANCTITSTDNTVINIDRISEDNYKNDVEEWEPVFSTGLTIPSGKKFDDGSSQIENPIVNKNDYFRLNMTEYSDIQNIVIELVIELLNI